MPLEGVIVGTVGRGPVAIHSSGKTIFSLTHIERITLGAGEEVDKVAGGAGGMGVKLKTKNITDEIKEYRKNWQYHIERLAVDRLPHQAYFYKSLGKRDLGCPRKR